AFPRFLQKSLDPCPSFELKAVRWRGENAERRLLPPREHRANAFRRSTLRFVRPLFRIGEIQIADSSRRTAEADDRGWGRSLRREKAPPRARDFRGDGTQASNLLCVGGGWAHRRLRHG